MTTAQLNKRHFANTALHEAAHAVYALSCCHGYADIIIRRGTSRTGARYQGLTRYECFPSLPLYAAALAYAGTIAECIYRAPRRKDSFIRELVTCDLLLNHTDDASDDLQRIREDAPAALHKEAFAKSLSAIRRHWKLVLHLKRLLMAEYRINGKPVSMRFEIRGSKLSVKKV